MKAILSCISSKSKSGHQRSLLNMTSINEVDQFQQKPQIAVQDAHASIIIPPLTLLSLLQWDDEVSESSQASKQVSHLSQLFGWKGTLPAGAMPAPSLALALALSLPLSSLRGQNHNSRNSTQPKNTSQTLRRTERPNRRSPQGPTWMALQSMCPAL